MLLTRWQEHGAGVIHPGVGIRQRGDAEFPQVGEGAGHPSNRIRNAVQAGVRRTASRQAPLVACIWKMRATNDSESGSTAAVQMRNARLWPLSFTSAASLVVASVAQPATASPWGRLARSPSIRTRSMAGGGERQVHEHRLAVAGFEGDFYPIGLVERGAREPRLLPRFFCQEERAEDCEVILALAHDDRRGFTGMIRASSRARTRAHAGGRPDPR